LSAFYDNLAATALRLIKDKGRSLLLARLNKASPNAVTGAPGATTAVQGTIDCIVLPAGTGDTLKLDTRLTEALIRGDLRKLLIAAKSVPFQPQPVDVTEFEDSYWSFVSCSPLNPAGTPLVYTAIL